MHGGGLVRGSWAPFWWAQHPGAGRSVTSSDVVRPDLPPATRQQ